MSNNKLSMEALNELRTIGAWKQMSEEFPWNEEQLERFKNNVDWNLVSANENVAWSISLIERFKNRLNWKELSQNDSNHLFQPEIIRAFADYWDWSELSGQSGWTPGLVEEFKDFSYQKPCRFRTSLWNKLCEETYKKLSDEVSGLTKK